MWLEQLRQIVVLPRAQQFEALRRLREAKDQEQVEEWNSAFGTESVYDAWTQLSFMQQLYSANRAVLRPLLDQRPHWHLVEIGGGNGALWQGFFHEQDRGTLTLIDPVPEVHATVSKLLPRGVALDSRIERVESVDLPQADALVCSLMLHHIGGQNVNQRSDLGLKGDGKLEVLQKFVEAVRVRNGLCLLNEADIYNEIDHAPAEPTLVEHFIDVYVRRAALAVATALAQPDLTPSLRQRWEIILQHWCLDQIDLAFATLEQRDVYELDVSRWLSLLQQAEARVLHHRYTDEWYLFHQYIFTCSQ